MCNFALVKSCVMRKVLFAILLSLLISLLLVPTGCTDKKPRPEQDMAADSILPDTSKVDSTEALIEDTPMPKAADELFDDFIFNFAGNRKLQRKRIVFPLKVYRNGKLAEEIPMNRWKMEHFFMRQQYYTLIFDNRKQMDLVKDTAVNHVVIEKIFFRKKLVQQFLFNRINGQFMMTSMNYKPMYTNKNADFLRFYDHFSRDSAYQVASMADEVEFAAPDPQNDFSNINGVIMPQQWPDFKPALIPKDKIYNIIYGQQYIESKRKLFVIRGISNSLEIEMSFRKIGNHWKLVKFNT
ncbi:putative lipoprotein [Hallella multisaccharivorax DSM 17128]|uniref:Putative lipoprotein n=2 Tax=Hallella multisaccharivorax TaxID=310514 RepID=F8N6U3_9BACT|nr:putative lipoprotein [Hallella multisaccharivorax DSM 17128]